jgi:3-methyl-2-oxobutanoate hydroxymethyltransferase
VSLTTSGNSLPRITTSILQDKKRKHEPITSLTAYDYASARLVDEAGIDVILVGDSLAMVMLGYETTLPVTMDEMLHHVRAVRRGVKHGMLVADMPYGSYQVSRKEGLHNAVRFVKEAGAEAVKIEGGEKRVPLIERLLDAQIPVFGHIGLTPQSVHTMGGYKVQGKTEAAIEQLLRDATAIDRAGVTAMYLEGIPREVAAMITAEVKCPTIGIGAGPDCDGQVLVLHDILNLTFAPAAKFVRRYGDAAALISSAVQAFKHDVESGAYPSDAESYHLPKEAQSAVAAVSVHRQGAATKERVV